MSIKRTKEPITLYMVTEQDEAATLYFHEDKEGNDLCPFWNRDIINASLLQTADEALEQAA